MDRTRLVLLAAVVGVTGLLLGFAMGHSGQGNGSASNPREITVNGTGTVSSVPTEADFDLGVTANAKTAEGATSANAARMTHVVSVLKSNGVAASDIQTSQLSLSPNTNPSGSLVLGFTATNTVSVRIRNLPKAGSIIDAAVGAGANQIDGPTLSTGDQQAIYRKALEAAIANARSRAQAIADAAGKKLGPLRSASETSNITPITFGASEAKAFSAPTPIEPGQAKTEADVTATFDFG